MASASLPSTDAVAGALGRVLLLCLLSLACAAAEPDPREIVRFIDGARAGGQPARIELSLTVEDAERKTRRRYRVLDDGAASVLVEFLDPLDRGQKLLATADELWFLSPRVHRAIKVPPAQRVFGEASYGDLARARWSRDYTVTFDAQPEEALDGHPCWRLRLSARRPAASYRSALLWVTKREWVPVRALYFAASGKLLKSAEFPGARIVDGRLENKVWVLRSAGAEQRRTTLEIESARPAAFSVNQFSRRYLELHP